MLPLLAAPALLLAAVADWFVADQLVTIGPFDRAQVGWLAVLLLALAPGVAALGEQRSGEVWRSRRVVAVVSLAVGVVVLVGMEATVTFVDCHPVTGPLDVLPRALATAAVSGLSFAAGFAAAEQFVRRGLLRWALVVGAAVCLFFAVFAVLLAVSWPLATCVPPQP